jgi:ADP-heptose:LPS heptosyltransferase
MKNGKAYAEQNLISLNEEHVPQSDNNIKVKVVAEQASKPLESHHPWVKQILIEMSSKLYLLLLQKLGDYYLVHPCADH